MSSYRYWDPTPPSLPKQPALAIDPILGVKPWSGARNPLTRSDYARRVSMTAVTPASAGERIVLLFESNAEYGAALETLLLPDFHNIEAQVQPIDYLHPTGEWRQHYYDLLVTLRCGKRIAYYVKAGSRLRHRDVQEEYLAICEYTPHSLCDEIKVVSSARYTRDAISNLQMIWNLLQRPDPSLDRHVLDVAKSEVYWDIRGLLSYCNLSTPAMGWQSVMRLIGKGLIEADIYNRISHYTRIQVRA
jgi:hypothetical protein